MESETVSSNGAPDWRRVYEEEADRLYGFFYAYTSRNAALAEDLVQETGRLPSAVFVFE